MLVGGGAGISEWYKARRDVEGLINEKSRPGRLADAVAASVDKESMMRSFPSHF